MHNNRPNMGPASRSFPQAKQTKAQRDEDAYMRAYGGPDTRLGDRIAKLKMMATRAIRVGKRP